MSDNDLISRMALYEKTAKWEAQALHMVEIHMHDEDTTEWRKWSTILTERSAFKFDVADAPAVPQEMSAVEYLKQQFRMCAAQSDGIKCEGCPLSPSVTGEYCDTYEVQYPEKTVEIVEAWAKEHPAGRSEE